MRVLIATGLYPPEIGGPATYSGFLADELPARGIAVDVLPFREVRRLPKAVRHFAYFFKAVRRGTKADIIFAQDPVSVGLPSVLAAKVLGKKFLIRVAGDYAWEQGVQRVGVKEGIDDFQNTTYGWRVELLRKAQYFVVRCADQVVTPSDYFNELVKKWGAKRVTTIYNGITFPELSDVKPYERREKIIFSAGRLVPWKGFAGLIELIAQMPDWELSIAGDGPERERLQALAHEKGVGDRAHFLGALPREQLFAELQKARVFVLNTSFESFSYQVVEAMYAGVPVVTTNIGSLPEIVEHEGTGILVTPDNAGSIQKGIERIDTDSNFRERVLRAARIKAKRFSLDTTVDGLVTLLQTL